MKKVKVLIATGLFPPQIGGPATYSKLLLDELPKRGFGVEVKSFGEVLKYPKILRHLIYFLKVFFASFSVDVIYAQDPVFVGLPSLIASKILGKKFYLKIVGDYAWEQGSQRWGVKDLLDEFSTEYAKYPLMVRFLKRVQLFVANHADKIIVPSNYLKKIVSNWGVNPNKIQVIYNAFHYPDFHGSKEEMRKKLNINYPMLVSAGRLVPWKGFDTLIALMPEIAREIPDAKLFITGDGPDKKYLNDCIKKAKAENCVVLTGKMSQENLFEHIKSADLFVLNTSYEGLSHQLLEVLYLETPVACSNAGGNVEVIDNNQNGTLFAYNDKSAIHESIIKLLNDKSLVKRYVEEGQKKLKSFDKEHMIEKISTFLRS
jgi:glycosyltransferase involved in cell wall biosynthesis